MALILSSIGNRGVRAEERIGLRSGEPATDIKEYFDRVAKYIPGGSYRCLLQRERRSVNTKFRFILRHLEAERIIKVSYGT